MSEPIRIFIGYDYREPMAFHVLAGSLLKRATVPVSITPITLNSVAGFFQRDRDAKQSTDFSFTRFLTPYLAGYKGWALYMDCDMLALRDIAELWKLRDEKYSLMCVKHDHIPCEPIKHFGEPQSAYMRKNWSSLMLMNCARCRDLSAEYVERAPGLELHQFAWLKDFEIGELPPMWNHLVDYNAPQFLSAIGILHYTLGTPNNCPTSGYAQIWKHEQMMVTL